jgi:hypothetical protein
MGDGEGRREGGRDGGMERGLNMLQSVGNQVNKPAHRGLGLSLSQPPKRHSPTPWRRCITASLAAEVRGSPRRDGPVLAPARRDARGSRLP